MNHALVWIQNINEFLWSVPLLLLLTATHIYFTLFLKFPQKKIGKAIRYSLSPSQKNSGNFSVFATLSTTLAATLGTGNIVGVSTAVALGGPGAIFWCWLTGILGMATSYAECFLSVQFRQKDPHGIYHGGPMYVWANGLHNKKIGRLYAFFTFLAAFFVGCFTQANSITQTNEQTFHLSPYLTGTVTVLLIALVILKGNDSIANACTKIVPFLAILYTLACLYLLIRNHSMLLPAIRLIVSHALAPRATVAGTVGSSLMLTARFGIARGLFTNEAGIGTAAITAAATEETDPMRQAYVSMTAVFWDTVVMCLLSGLVIVTNMLLHPESLTGVSDGSYVDAAFSYLPFGGNTFLSLCLTAFAITTLIGWSYIGQQAYGYLFSKNRLLPYKLMYLLMIFIGSILPLSFVWECADLINACMVLPNVGALFLLQRELRS